MSAYRLRPTVVWKSLQAQIGLLNTETAEFYLLDSMASDVLRNLLKANLSPESIPSLEEVEIIDNLIDIGFVEKG